MPNILENMFSLEMSFLEELAEELECTFHVIAHAGYEKDLPYIRKSQKYFRERYGNFLKHVQTEVGSFHIIPAYEGLQDLLDNNPTSDEIIDRCEECLEEHLMKEESFEEDINPFQEFYTKI